MYLPYISYKPCSVGNAPNWDSEVLVRVRTLRKAWNLQGRDNTERFRMESKVYKVWSCNVITFLW
jgi:hypothetical protein